VDKLYTRIAFVDIRWTKVLQSIKSQVSPANYKTWFSKAAAQDLNQKILTIGVPNGFVKENILKKHPGLLEGLVKDNFGTEIEINLKVDPSLQTSAAAEETDLTLDNFISPNYNSQNTLLANLNPRYTMDNFVVGLSNNLGYAAAQAVIQNPGLSYNPLFIYGGTGVGKTHLMHGIGNSLIKKDSLTKIIYCSSERFTNDFVASIQNKQTSQFRAKYRNCDLLLIDDIQFISGRDSTQEEFFHTFNELQTKNIQVVLTSDRPPTEIQKLEPRLQSRFQGGLMVDIQTPDFDTRVAILRAKCQEKGDLVPEECLTLIAEKVATNARELEGKLTQLIQTLKLSGREINLENIQALLGVVNFTTPFSLKFDHKKVLLQINQYFNIKMVDLTGPRRKKNLVLPRQLAMFLLYEDCKLPYERIGDLLGGRDHTTIMHGVDKIRQNYQRDREIQRMIIELKQNLSTN